MISLFGTVHIDYFLSPVVPGEFIEELSILYIHQMYVGKVDLH